MLHNFVALSGKARIPSLVALVLYGLSGITAVAQATQIHIHILNAKNGHPIKNRNLDIVFGNYGHEGTSDANGTIVVTADPKSTISLVTQPYAECRPKSSSPWEIKYSVEDILAKGFSTPNVCGKAHAVAKPGEIIIFERPRGLLNVLAAPIAY